MYQVVISGRPGDPPHTGDMFIRQGGVTSLHPVKNVAEHAIPVQSSSALFRILFSFRQLSLRPIRIPLKRQPVYW
jgi:hypothetical protein